MMLRALLVEPGCDPKSVEIPNTFSAKQQLVGGPIDILEFADDGAVIVLNDEGKNQGLPYN